MSYADIETYRRKLQQQLADGDNEGGENDGSGTGDLTPPSVYEEKGLLTRHEIEDILKKYGAVIAQDRKKPEGGELGNPLAAHPILSQYPIFDGADPKVAAVPSMSEEAALNYMEYQLDYQARKELGNAKRRKFNPTPGT